MISSWEHKQLAEVCYRILSRTKIEDGMFFDRVNDIRKLHNKYQSIVDKWIEYPHYRDKESYNKESKDALLVYQDIKRICKDGNIESKFYKIPEDYFQFRKQFAKDRRYVDYYYQNMQITDMIVFVKENIKEVVVPDLNEDEIGQLDLGIEETGIPEPIGPQNITTDTGYVL